MLTIRNATENDVPLILQFIRDLAEYERLAHACVATEEQVRETLFGARRHAEVIIAEHDGAPAGFALSPMCFPPGIRAITNSATGTRVTVAPASDRAGLAQR